MIRAFRVMGVQGSSEFVVPGAGCSRYSGCWVLGVQGVQCSGFFEFRVFRVLDAGCSGCSGYWVLGVQGVQCTGCWVLGVQGGGC